MTIRYVGSLAASPAAPHVYFILAQGLLYVGETQKHPVVRWNQHLQPEGSFRMAAFARGQVEIDVTDRIGFYAVEIEPLATLFPAAQIKAATQAVEHEVHMLLRARPSFLGLDLQIISDTARTAPRAFRRWDIAQALAEEAATVLRAALPGAQPVDA